VDSRALEVCVVQLLDSRGEIASRLVLHKAFTGSSRVTVTADFAVHDIEAGLTCKILQILPARLEWQTSDGHAVHSATRPWCLTWRSIKTVAWAVATTSELDHQTFAHELGAMKCCEH